MTYQKDGLLSSEVQNPLYNVEFQRGMPSLDDFERSLDAAFRVDRTDPDRPIYPNTQNAISALHWGFDICVDGLLGARRRLRWYLVLAYGMNGSFRDRLETRASEGARVAVARKSWEMLCSKFFTEKREEKSYSIFEWQALLWDREILGLTLALFDPHRWGWREWKYGILPRDQHDRNAYTFFNNLLKIIWQDPELGCRLFVDDRKQKTELRTLASMARRETLAFAIDGPSMHEPIRSLLLEKATIIEPSTLKELRTAALNEGARPLASRGRPQTIEQAIGNYSQVAMLYQLLKTVADERKRKENIRQRQEKFARAKGALQEAKRA